MTGLASAVAGRASRARSLANKLALLFAGVVLLAFAVVYFFIVPQLRANLEQQMLEELAAEAQMSAGPVEEALDEGLPGPEIDTRVRRAAEEAGARVSLLGLQQSVEDEARGFYTISDSSVDSPSLNNPLADPAPTAPPPEVSVDAASRAVDLGIADTALGRAEEELVAQAAVPLSPGSGLPPEWVAVYSQPLESVDEAVSLIQRQLLFAGVLAVLVALAGGWLVARTVARRVRRLESAATEVAEGRSFKPLPVESEDELGELTRTFNEMQEQLARLDRSRRDFIANASHELRTPIFSLGGFAELLADEDLDEPTRERFLQSMREQIDRLKRLAQDLLDLSRLDAGALELHRRDADVSEVVEMVAHEFSPAAAERGARLEVKLPPEGLAAHCDPDRVAQIVRVLLDNALRHTPPGTPVTVAGGHSDGAVELTVADAGEGLDPAVAERVFERFYTADAASGSGLGLAIARELTEAMDGAIGATSGPGGTTFSLRLPAPIGDSAGTGKPRDGDQPVGAPARRVPAVRA